jgi:very-short-patch-repair endonuclease
MHTTRLTRDRARDLRKQMSLPEVLLWRELRKRQVEGYRFRRQHPLGPYVLDFYCEAVKLAVEIDGYGHSLGDQPARYERRDAWLAQQGVSTLRLQATDVLKSIDDAVTAVWGAAHSRDAYPELASSDNGARFDDP